MGNSQEIISFLLSQPNIDIKPNAFYGSQKLRRITFPSTININHIN